MAVPHPPSDDDLLTTDDAEAFGMFYDRHVHSVLGYFARRTGDPEVAADLTAETFASALTARRRFKPGGAPAGGGAPVSGWQAQWQAFPALLLVTSGGLNAVVELSQNLDVDAERMRANLEVTQGLIMAEAVSIALSAKVGRAEAQKIMDDLWAIGARAILVTDIAACRI